MCSAYSTHDICREGAQKREAMFMYNALSIVPATRHDLISKPGGDIDCLECLS